MVRGGRTVPAEAIWRVVSDIQMIQVAYVPAVQNNNQMSRIPINAMALWAVFALLVICAQGTAINWYKNVTTPNFRASFQLQYASSGSVISAVINPSDQSAAYNVLFWQPGFQSPQAAQFQNLGPFTGPKIINSSALSFSGSWRIEIQPSSSNFLFTAEFKVDNTSVGKYSGIASNKRVFILYSSTMGDYSISLSLSTGRIADLPVTLYGPFPTLTYTGGSSGGVVSTLNSYDKVINYTSSGSAYYYLIIDGSNLFNDGPLLRLSFQSDTYQCPFGTDTTDYNGIFPTCSSSVATSGFPCISFNNIVNRCESCFNGWVPNGMGLCVQNTDCGVNQYYSFGKCYDALSHCTSFERFGGTCQACEADYTLINYDNGTQLCEAKVPTCKAEQYLLGKKCMNLVAHCANFISSTGTCEKCELGYDGVNNVCVEKKVVQKVCPTGQQAVNDICQIIDKKCTYYGPNNKCQICADGYKEVNGNCVQITCPDRQYSVHGFCSDVSPVCGQYDKIYGNCLTCINPFYVLQLDGTCIQTLDPNANGIAVISCQDGYFPRSNTCVQVSNLCNGYDKSNGNCLACVSPSEYVLQKGICVSIRGYCAGTPRTFFKDGQCAQVSPLCDQYNDATGACLNCLDKTVFNEADGTCKYNQACRDRQYHQFDGSCADVSSDCTTYDASNGSCTGCIDGKQLNLGSNGKNVCCRVGYYIEDKACLPFLAANCQTVNAKFGYCETCNAGFTKAYYYGKCQPK